MRVCARVCQVVYQRDFERVNDADLWKYYGSGMLQVCVCVCVCCGEENTNTGTF